MKKTVIITCILIALVGCRQKVDIVPKAPDYKDTTQWYIVDRGAAVDVFYVISTETGDYSRDGICFHHADTRDDSLRMFMNGEMVGVDNLLAGNLNYYSPYYRQCTMETFTSDSLVEARMPLAYGDIRKAFKYYLKHYNGGRPFILAGFSQGAMAVVDLVKTMDDKTYSRMVAAYVIGYKVTNADMAASSHIRPAKDSIDQGVMICYNSVRDNSCALPLLSQGNRMAINPVNWRIDATPALLVDPRYGDTLTVALDTTSLLLLIDGYRRDDYMLPLIGCEGNYHRLEISLFSEHIRRNIALRASKTQQK